MSAQKIALIILAGFHFIIGNQCGNYSFSGSSLPAHIRTIAVPMFENKTTEFGVPEDITDALINEFTQDNTLKVVDQKSADAMLDGTILNIREQAGAYDVKEQVKEIRIYVTVQAKFEDLKQNNVIWEGQLVQWGTYNPDALSGENTTRQDAIREAIHKIVMDIFNKTISEW